MLDPRVEYKKKITKVIQGLYGDQIKTHAGIAGYTGKNNERVEILFMIVAKIRSDDFENGVEVLQRKIFRALDEKNLNTMEIILLIENPRDDEVSDLEYELNLETIAKTYFNRVKKNEIH